MIPSARVRDAIAKPVHLVDLVGTRVISVVQTRAVQKPCGFNYTLEAARTELGRFSSMLCIF